MAYDGNSQVESGLELLADTTATAVQDQSHICDLHHSSWQQQILNSLSKAGDRTCILMDISPIPFHCATAGTPDFLNLFIYFAFFFKDLFSLFISTQLSV